MLTYSRGFLNYLQLESFDIKSIDTRDTFIGSICTNNIYAKDVGITITYARDTYIEDPYIKGACVKNTNNNDV